MQTDAAHLHIFNGIIKDALITQNIIMTAGNEMYKRQRGSSRRITDKEAKQWKKTRKEVKTID